MVSTQAAAIAKKLTSEADWAFKMTRDSRNRRKEPATSPLPAASWKVECGVNGGSGISPDCPTRTHHIQSKPVHSNGISEVINDTVYHSLGLKVCRINIIDIPEHIPSKSVQTLDIYLAMLH